MSEIAFLFDMIILYYSRASYQSSRRSVNFHLCLRLI